MVDFLIMEFESLRIGILRVALENQMTYDTIWSYPTHLNVPDKQ